MNVCAFNYKATLIIIGYLNCSPTFGGKQQQKAKWHIHPENTSTASRRDSPLNLPLVVSQNSFRGKTVAHIQMHSLIRSYKVHRDFLIDLFYCMPKRLGLRQVGICLNTQIINTQII